MAKKPRIKVLITGGPTRAYLDEVRYLSNFSTGSLAFELCRELARNRIEVFAVIGPSMLPFETLRLRKLVRVETRSEMQNAVLKIAGGTKPSWGIFAAAVLDFEPSRRMKGKVKSTGVWSLRLRPTPKIIDAVGKAQPSLKRIGFKLEARERRGTTRDRFAMSYLRRKGLEALCLNFRSEVGTKKHLAYLYGPEGLLKKTRSKSELARALASLVAHSR